ncbi:hypothetical protein [Rhabdothermincola sp.]|uniref:hypothetical protein n=1 Tax=Rhabdothermincola sp. TaxID=2820405 RepID=UPI002FE2AB49
MPLTVTVRTRPGQPTVWLEVAYDGLEPPSALFADLEMIGWRPPAPASPPRSAIDWSTPNPRTGERFTIRNWRVERQIIEPPPGSGPRGAWTVAERGAFLRAAEGVLRRHGVYALSAEAASLLSPPTTDQPTRPSPAPPAATAPNEDATGAEAPTRTEGQRGRQQAGAADALVTIIVEPVRRVAVSTLLAERGLEGTWSAATVTVRHRYRGSEYDAETPAQQVDVRVPPTEAMDLAAVLAAAAGVRVDDPARCSITLPDPASPTSGAPPLALVHDADQRRSA